VQYLVRRHKVSERRACRLVGQHRSTQRYQVVVPEQERQLVKAMNAIATKRPRWGYRRVYQVLRDEGWTVNRKRVERLWRLEGHRVLGPESPWPRWQFDLDAAGGGGQPHLGIRPDEHADAPRRPGADPQCGG